MRRLLVRTGRRILHRVSTASHAATATVRALLERLPGDCSLDDVLCHLYVVQAVSRGMADAEGWRLVPHEEVAAHLRRRGPRGSAP